MTSGVVRNNTHRKLEVNEFRGFALSDRYAPLIVVNANDAKSAQMFTIAHELAHIWLGDTGVSNIGAYVYEGPRREEQWCNKVAAELLVPTSDLRSELRANETLSASKKRLTRCYKVSGLVVLRRIFDIDALSRNHFDQAWVLELDESRKRQQNNIGGGNFYMTALKRTGRRFAERLIGYTLEGRTSYTEALDLLGIRKIATFNKLSQEVGILVR